MKEYGLKGYTVEFCNDEYDCVSESDAVVFMTEWNQFRNLNIERIKITMGELNFFDFRNIYEPSQIKKLGFFYDGAGRR